MKNRIIVNDVRISNNRIDYDWYPEGDVKECFNLTEPLFYEYSEAIKNVPKSIAILPFLCNIMPLAWLYDTEILVDEVDRAFYESLAKVKQGFIEMYPMLSFQGSLQAKAIVENSFAGTDPKSAVFFSGGVDSNFTLISHLDEKPALMTIIGADVALTDKRGIESLTDLAANAGKQYELDTIKISSSFRNCLNYRKLNAKTAISKNGYWGGFQHGMAICGQSFPYAFTRQINTVYIASSRWAKDKDYHAWGSAPAIDDNLRFASGRVVHDGYDEYNRQDKVRNICEYVSRTGEKIHLHVCWETSGGRNCCCCEKCFRTMLAILLEGGDPNKFGFHFTADTGLIMEKYFRHVCDLDGSVAQRWLDLQHKYCSDKGALAGVKNFEWLENFDFNRPNAYRFRLLRSIWKRSLRAFSSR